MQQMTAAPARCTCACSCGARPEFAVDKLSLNDNQYFGDTSNTSVIPQGPTTTSGSPLTEDSHTPVQKPKYTEHPPGHIVTQDSSRHTDTRDSESHTDTIASQKTITNDSAHDRASTAADNKSAQNPADNTHASSAYDESKPMSPEALKRFFTDKCTESPRFRNKNSVEGPIPLAPWHRSQTGPDMSVKEARVTHTRKNAYKKSITSQNKGIASDQKEFRDSTDSLLEEDGVLGVGHPAKRNSVSVGVLGRIVHKEARDERTFGRLVKQQSLLRRRVNSDAGTLNFHELMELFGVPSTALSMELAKEVAVPDDPDVFHTMNCDILDLLLNRGRDVTECETIRHEHEVFPMSISFNVAYRDIW